MMRYQLDTIPVWDAVKAETECPFCAMQRALDASYVESFLGAGYMEPALRIEVNEKGFCARHYRALFAAPNRLGVGLMTHTFLKELIGDFEPLLTGMAANAAKEAQKNPVTQQAGKMMGASRERKDMVALAQQMHQRLSTCVICERIQNSLHRYYFTYLHLYQKDADFRIALERSKGICLTHLPFLLSMAAEELSAKELTGFMQLHTELTQKNLARLEQEVEWFTLKFDYRNAEKPWGNSRDALERAIQKIKGPIIPAEKK